MRFNPITKPKHYNQFKYEPLDVIEDWDLPHHLACVVKYISRYRFKNGAEDLKKAEYYLIRFNKLYGKKG